jgi:hypothetical protein
MLADLPRSRTCGSPNRDSIPVDRVFVPTVSPPLLGPSLLKGTCSATVYS